MLIPCSSTCVLSPSEDGGDLVALCRVTLGSDRSCAHAHRALVGLDPAQVSCGRAGAVWHLCVSVVCLQRHRSLDMSSDGIVYGSSAVISLNMALTQQVLFLQ